MTGRPAAKGRKGGEAKPAKRAKVEAQASSSGSSVAFDSEEIAKRSALLWEPPHQPTRGPKPALNREDVVAAAIRVADAGDLAALTMHAVAAQLGYTPMALYRYFPNKEALVDAAVDAALGAPPKRDGPHEGWRAEIRHWAYAKRAMLCARPWLAELPFVAAPHGPNWLRWLEALADALSDIGLNGADIGQMLSIIDAYTRGASDTAVSLARARARGSSDEVWTGAVGADLGRAIGDPRFPRFAAVLTAPAEEPPRTLEESFEFGLQRVLDGIELYLARVG